MCPKFNKRCGMCKVYNDKYADSRWNEWLSHFPDYVSTHCTAERDWRNDCANYGRIRVFAELNVIEVIGAIFHAFFESLFGMVIIGPIAAIVAVIAFSVGAGVLGVIVISIAVLIFVAFVVIKFRDNVRGDS
ncbi:MAG: hypothetical protein FWC70_09915 [Defluviitaleaceae bacterium]|nr:hypothetical protein [Defluviitaleaceae bacterium]